VGTREQRQTERFEIERPIEVQLGDQTAVGKTLNLSLGGALVDLETETFLSMGARVELRFTLPDLDDPVTLQAEVRWVDDMRPTRAGLQFTTGLRAKQTWALNRLFERSRGQG
jgi:hypothetical protein